MEQKILDGRNLVETYRADHAKLYNVIDKDFDKLSNTEKYKIQYQITTNHTKLHTKLKQELAVLGFIETKEIGAGEEKIIEVTNDDSINLFFSASAKADIDNKIPIKERWE